MPSTGNAYLKWKDARMFLFILSLCAFVGHCPIFSRFFNIIAAGLTTNPDGPAWLQISTWCLYISLYHSFLCSIAETAQYMDIISVVVVVVYVDFSAAIGGP